MPEPKQQEVDSGYKLLLLSALPAGRYRSTLAPKLLCDASAEQIGRAAETFRAAGDWTGLRELYGSLRGDAQDALFEAFRSFAPSDRFALAAEFVSHYKYPIAHALLRVCEHIPEAAELRGAIEKYVLDECSVYALSLALEHGLKAEAVEIFKGLARDAWLSRAKSQELLSTLQHYLQGEALSRFVAKADSDLHELHLRFGLALADKQLLLKAFGGKDLLQCEEIVPAAMFLFEQGGLSESQTRIVKRAVALGLSINREEFVVEAGYRAEIFAVIEAIGSCEPLRELLYRAVAAGDAECQELIYDRYPKLSLNQDKLRHLAEECYIHGRNDFRSAAQIAREHQIELPLDSLRNCLSVLVAAAFSKQDERDVEEAIGGLGYLAEVNAATADEGMPLAELQRLRDGELE